MNEEITVTREELTTQTPVPNFQVGDKAQLVNNSRNVMYVKSSMSRSFDTDKTYTVVKIKKTSNGQNLIYLDIKPGTGIFAHRFVRIVKDQLPEELFEI